MPKSITAIYAGMLREPNLSAEHQNRIFEYARLRQEDELFQALIRHPKLTDELDAKFATFTETKLRGAWFTRPGRDPKVIEEALKSEKSLVLLAYLAALELPQEAYKALALTEGARISEALLGNPYAPKEAKLIAAKRWGRGFRLKDTEKAKEAIALYLDNDPDLITVALEATSSPTLVRELVGTGFVSQEKLCAVTDAVLANIRKQNSKVASVNNHSWQYNYEDVNSWSTPLYGAFNELYDLIKNTPLPAAARDSINTFLSDTKLAKSAGTPDSWSGQCSSLQKMIRRAYSSRGIFANRPAIKLAVKNSKLKKSPSTGTQAAFAAALAAKDRGLALRVLQRPDATPEMGIKASALARYSVKPTEIKGISQAVLCAFFVASPSLISESTLMAAERPAELILEMLRSEQNCPNRSYLLNACMTSRFLSYDALLEFPVSYLAKGNVPLYVHQVYGRELLKAFGESPAAWEVFESLSDEFEGTFAELLATSSALV